MDAQGTRFLGRSERPTLDKVITTSVASDARTYGSEPISLVSGVERVVAAAHVLMPTLAMVSHHEIITPTVLRSFEDMQLELQGGQTQQAPVDATPK